MDGTARGDGCGGGGGGGAVAGYSGALRGAILAARRRAADDRAVDMDEGEDDDDLAATVACERGRAQRWLAALASGVALHPSPSPGDFAAIRDAAETPGERVTRLIARWCNAGGSPAGRAAAVAADDAYDADAAALAAVKGTNS